MATYTFPDPNGGSMTVQGANFAEAKQNASAQGWNPSMGTFGANTGPDVGGGSSGGGGGGGGADPQAAARAMDAQISSIIQALSTTNEQDFQEKIREFNQGHALALQQFGFAQQAQQFQQAATAAGLTGQYQGQPTLAAQQQQFGQAATAAGLTGQYQGQPTLANLAQQAQFSGQYQGKPTLAAQLQQAQLSGMYGGQPTEAAREFNTSTGVDLAKLSSSLSGPADYFKYLTSLNAGRNIVGTLQGGQPAPAFGAPQNGVQPQSIQNILGGLGLGGTGGQQQNPQSMTSAQGGVTIPGFEGFGTLPFPHQIQPTAWTNLGPTGQSFMKGAYAAAGYDPNDVERQIQATAPSTGRAPQTSSSSASFASPSSQSLFA